MVELLISKDADVNVAAKDGRTPLQAAKKKGHAEVVELLLKHGAKK